MSEGLRAPDVLVVTRNLPPLVGGMERLNAHVVEELSRQFRVSLVGPKGCQAMLHGISGVAEVPVRPLWRFLLLSLWRALAVAIRTRPRIVMGGSGLVAPITWLTARVTGARCAVYLHGLDMIAPSAVYKKVWLPLIRRHDLCIVNSNYSRTLALAAGIPQQAIRVLHPGVELPESLLPASVALRRTLGVETNRVLLYVGRLTRRKGLLEFVERVLPGLLRYDGGIRLLVVGDEAADALAEPGNGYLPQVQAMASKMQVAHAISFLGGVSEEMLAAAYSVADVLIFPVIHRPGDAEGFGMVAIEAAAYGVPTVAFAVGGIPDAVSDGASGMLVEPGDYDALARAVQRAVADHSMPECREKCRLHAARFQWSIFGETLRQLLTELANGPIAKAV